MQTDAQALRANHENMWCLTEVSSHQCLQSKCIMLEDVIDITILVNTKKKRKEKIKSLNTVLYIDMYMRGVQLQH